MTIATQDRRWKGIIPPMVTPLLARDELDYAGLEKLIEHILAGGAHGLFILGTTGEGPALSYRLRRELVERTCKQAAGRAPVLVCITDTAVVEALAIADFAANHGADAVVMAPPYYYPNSQPELLEYFENVSRELPLPLFLYNMPTHTKTSIDVETLRRAADLPNIVGVKDSSGNMVYFHQLVRLLAHRPDWSLLVGPEELLGEAVMLGGHGGVSGGANLFPRLYVDLYEAAAAKDTHSVSVLHGKVMQISASLYQVGKHSSSFLKGVKCALRLLGICGDYMAAPFHRFRDTESKRVRGILEDLGYSIF